MKRLAALALGVCAAGAAHAEDAAICTDRPGKANAVCTVPAGRIQGETAAVDWSLTEGPGTRAELLTVGATYVKLGVSGGSDLEIGFTPYAALTTRDASASRVAGVGDVVIRYKQRLTGADARVQVAWIPFVKLPTAPRRVGNGAVEGGVAVPASFTLSGPVTMTLGPEIDLLADSPGKGKHLALVNLVNVSAPIAPRVTLSGELWSNVNFQRGATSKQASADAALAYALSNHVQVDVGANLGLTSATADVEAYAGLSVRF
jgi:hypothetical protein